MIGDAAIHCAGPHAYPAWGRQLGCCRVRCPTRSSVRSAKVEPSPPDGRRGPSAGWSWEWLVPDRGAPDLLASMLCAPCLLPSASGCKVTVSLVGCHRWRRCAQLRISFEAYRLYLRLMAFGGAIRISSAVTLGRPGTPIRGSPSIRQDCHPARRNPVIANQIGLGAGFAWRESPASAARLLVVELASLPHGHLHDGDPDEV